ncbi:Tyrosyl-DNA phosphodiesterase 1 [Nymphaea thermarum]|nr:Tyrosyl-DNA phosphodiesterase 1 [Nymphaea thermarum]
MFVRETHKRQQSEAPVACCSKKGRARYHRQPECLHLRATASPLVSSSSGRSYRSVCLSADRVYTFGRGQSCCDFCFRDRRVSRQHCQVLFDSYEGKVFIIDGAVNSSSELEIDKVQERLGRGDDSAARRGSNCSMNGVYVNGSKLKGRAIFQLFVGDVVSFVCSGRSSPIGFVVHCIIFADKIITRSNAESICGPGYQRCGESSVRLQCLQSVYERLSNLYFSRTRSPGKVISRKKMLSGVEFSQDSIDSLCRRFVHVSGHYDQTTNRRRRRVSLLEVDQGSSNLELHAESKISDASGDIATGLMGTSNLIILSKTCEKRSLKRGYFCGTYSDGELILRALLLLKKCRLARKDLNNIMCFNNNFGNSSALVGRRLGKAEAFDEGSFPPTAYGGTYKHFKGPDVIPKVTDLIPCDLMYIEHGKINLVTDTGSFGSAPSREIVRCQEIPNMNIELNERYSITKRIEGFESSCEIGEVSVLGDCMGKNTRILVTGTNQCKERSLPSYGGNVMNLFSAKKIGEDAFKMRLRTESAIQHKIFLDHRTVSAQNTVGCVSSIPCEPSLADAQCKFMNENIEGLKRNKDIHTPESDGETLFLNRLEFMTVGSTDKPPSVSLPELLSPVESLSRIFVATFTSNISWFLSACKIPNNLPVTVACHDTERCWNPVHEQRWSQPYAQYPNLVVVHPPFPDEIAIAKDKKKKGVACHHPKLLILLREESIRVIITSANLVPKQWNNVTNTIWWQDFPRRKSPEYFSLFTHLHVEREEISEELKSEFLAQLAGFIASLLVDIPNQAYWIKELCHYDFTKASCHLVASIPGIQESMFPYNLEHVHYLTELQPIHQTATRCSEFVGSVVASLVGLSHRFQAKVDPGGVQLKALASIIQKRRENAYGMLEVILQRNHCIPADCNAVSVIINHPAECSEHDASSCEDHLQLGFLPRSVAKWVAPLCDASLFSFSAYVFPQQVLAAALSGCNSRGPNFFKISNLIQHEHVVAICYLLASIQRNLGIWRLHEVLSKYQWPDSEEVDFVYGASSIGSSLNPHFLAAFATAAGKRSSQFLDSEESDPEWGLWNAEHESHSPSIKIIFPTMERVKLGATGIWPYRHLLSFSEKTWQRLRAADILYDAIPYPSERVGHPMHVKVAQRRFWNKTTSSSFGWIYFGSHNLSAAAWGYPLTDSPESGSVSVGSSVLGSRLRISNYELGLVLVVPPPQTSKGDIEKNLVFDNIILPFVVPAPKYKLNDRPATMQAMREACAVELEKQMAILVSGEDDLMNEDMIDDEDEDEDEDEDIIEVTESATEEKEEDKLYAERLWSQVDSTDA